MQISLSKSQAEYVAQQLAEGKFENIEDLIDCALGLLSKTELEVEELKSHLSVSLKTGRLRSDTEVASAVSNALSAIEPGGG